MDIKKKSIVFGSILLSTGFLFSIAYASIQNGGILQETNVQGTNVPLDTPIEHELQLQKEKMLTIHAVSNGNGGIKEKEVRVEADHIVWGASVVNKASSGLTGDGNFYVTDGDAFFQGRVNLEASDVFTAPEMTLTASNHQRVGGQGKIRGLSYDGWRDGSIISMRFLQNHEIAHMAQVNQGFGQIFLKDQVDRIVQPNATLLLVLDEDKQTGKKIWFEL